MAVADGNLYAPILLPAGGIVRSIGSIIHYELFPSQVLGERHRLALSFKILATLRTDAKLFADVNELEWRGPTAGFLAVCERLDAPDLFARVTRAAGDRAR